VSEQTQIHDMLVVMVQHDLVLCAEGRQPTLPVEVAEPLAVRGIGEALPRVVKHLYVHVQKRGMARVRKWKWKRCHDELAIRTFLYHSA
jgi:hypothetical protein